jgi:hypothetical protein
VPACLPVRACACEAPTFTQWTSSALVRHHISWTILTRPQLPCLARAERRAQRQIVLTRRHRMLIDPWLAPPHSVRPVAVALKGW